MKKINIYISALFWLGLLLWSCEEDERGPLTLDSTIPQQVSEVEVTNVSGGARIAYNVPTDKDVLLIEAVYTLESGREVTTKSSVYKNYITIEGLRGEKPQEVKLVTVDKSNNRSEPVSVTINPLKAPIDMLYESFDMIADFGGARLLYNNENLLRAELKFYAKGENGKLEYQRSVFLQDDTNTFEIFRGFEPEATTFGVSIIDRWDNTTEIKEFELTPLFEEELSQENFADPGMLSGDEPDAWGWVKPNMWDGNINTGFHTNSTQTQIIPPYTEVFEMATVDLGVTAKLSRFKMYQRQGGFLYNIGNVKHFEIWGIAELPADNGASLETEGWVRLVKDGEVVKPSGLPLGQLSSEDRAAGAEGSEFLFPIDAPPVRYIRIVNKQNFEGNKFWYITELRFWGQIEN